MPETEITLPAGCAILHKLHAIMEDVSFIAKDKENSFHHYRYASEEAIKRCLHDAFVKHRVVPRFSVVSIDERVGLGKSGTESLTKIGVKYRFTCIDTGEFDEGEFFGVGIDNADKGIYKAITGAIKYILTSAFLIPTGDDPESEGQRPKPDKQTRAAAPAPGPQPPHAPAVVTPRPAVVTPRPAVARPASGNFKLLSEFSTAKADLKKITGDDRKYYSILGTHGFEHSTDIPTIDKGREIWREMKGAFKDAMDAVTQ